MQALALGWNFDHWEGKVDEKYKHPNTLSKKQSTGRLCSRERGDLFCRTDVGILLIRYLAMRIHSTQN